MQAISRRHALTLFSGVTILSVAGCCELRGPPKPQIKPGNAFAAPSPSAFLAPRTINTIGVPTPDCIDVHAHFFNASDVTIKGYLEGPVAYSMGDVLGPIVRLLAPIADALGEFAPTASDEYHSLERFASGSLVATDERAALQMERRKEREAISVEFNKLVQSPRGRAFRDAYERLMEAPAGLTSGERRPRVRRLGDDSLVKAMDAAEAPADDVTVRAFAETDKSPYAEGILAFVGYMLHSRRYNLLTYQEAFTEKEGTLGVRRALGAMVDFDRWLACAPRSAHEDQMRLHLKLSELTNGYMLPIVSYNPWSDVKEHGRSLALVEEAIKAGCVGVKIYPPNGFRPWGNSGHPSVEGPTGEQIDEALKKLWLKCLELKVPVMAHAGPSMGRDEYHNQLGGPDAWQALLDANFWPDVEGPRVSLGHFGGDGASSDWTSRFATVMGRPRAQRVFADLGYWEELRCDVVGTQTCNAAKQRLRDVLDKAVGGGETVADRVMYGSDWLMLSKEKNWLAYANQLLQAMADVSAGSVPRIFGDNAKKCFGDRLQLT